MNNSLAKSYIGNRVAATILDYAIVCGFTIFYILEVGESDYQGNYTVNGIPALGPPLFWFCYIVLLERYAGGTLGHLLFKLRVTSTTQERITLGRIILRRIVDPLEICFCFGLIALLIAKNTPGAQRLGDLIAKTQVVGNIDVPDDIRFDFETENVV